MRSQIRLRRQTILQFGEVIDSMESTHNHDLKTVYVLHADCISPLLVVELGATRTNVFPTLKISGLKT